MKKQKNKFTKKQKNKFFPINPKKSDNCSLITISAVRVFHSVALGILMADVVFHRVASRTLSGVMVLLLVEGYIMKAITIFAQNAEVLYQPLEYFRSCIKNSIAR